MVVCIREILPGWPGRYVMEGLTSWMRGSPAVKSGCEGRLPAPATAQRGVLGCVEQVSGDRCLLMLSREVLP